MEYSELVCKQTVSTSELHIDTLDICQHPWQCAGLVDLDRVGVLRPVAVAGAEPLEHDLEKHGETLLTLYTQ